MEHDSLHTLNKKDFEVDLNNMYEDSFYLNSNDSGSRLDRNAKMACPENLISSGVFFYSANICELLCFFILSFVVCATSQLPLRGPAIFFFRINLNLLP
ncbi:hypothetical protein SAMN05216436_13418 [bacterium A37T11]|nr:hypothetical protein SAMN05216436_13418 [bacterium A37T11]